MKTAIVKTIVLAMTGLAFLAGQALGGENLNGNGFPSGPHYNLNIIGKKDGFTCPPPEYYDGTQIYGNVIFVPEVTKDDPSLQDPVQIIFQSGLKGPKSAPTITELQVRDWCTGFLGTGSATILLPKNDAGYDVYARALAKPTDYPNITIYPSLDWVQDELGNDLYYLGSLGSFQFFDWDTNTLYRPKKSKGLDITPIFEFTGEVCYLTIPPDSTYTEKALCGLDTTVPPDGVYEEIIPANSVEFPETGCPVGYVPLTGYCKLYDSTWVFNIGDFVQYLWGLDNNGVKLLQIRFYPL